MAAAVIASAAIPAQEKKDPPIDWQKLLADLRERFAKSQEPTLQQTRIDRAYFSLNEDDPDQPPFLNFKGVCLRGVHDDEKQMKDVLRKELGKVAIPGVKYALKIDEIAFHDTPIYALQKAAVDKRKTDPALNVFFERATYAADGSFQLHVLFLQDAPAEKIAKLYEEDHPIPPELLKLPAGKAKTPTVVRRAYDWLAKLKELRRQFADDPDPLMQRTRFDTGFLAYSEDRKSVHFHVDGVCVHPPDLVADAERVKRWSKPLSNLIPKVVYAPNVDGVVMHANPSIAWQNEAAGQESHDGIFFQLAQFDGVGVLKASVKLPTEAERAAALKIVAEKPAPARLGVVAEKNFDFQLWNWKEVIPKAQTRLARGDFLEHRTRLDRVFLKYDDVKRGIPFMHFEGVSLHPTEIDKAEALRSRLQRSFGDLPPSPLEHKLHSERIQFVTSPIYALQTEAVAKSLDGLLFADGRYDAEGKLHIGIVLGAPEQRDIARKMVEALPMPEGAVRPKTAKDQPLLDYMQIAWNDVLHEMQRWLARSGESLLKKSRLERGFFSYPPSKAGPDLNMALVGIYPNKDALTAKLKKRLDAYVLLSLTDQLRAGPIAVVPTIENIDNPAITVQAKVHELPALDGVRLDDASFDGDGKLILYGIWNGKKQQPALDKLIRDTLAEAHPVLKRGINWGSLQEYDTAGLLHSMRVWVAGQEAIDEVWLERIFFDAGGKVRVVGFFTRPADKEKALRTLPEFLPRFESKALPSVEPAEPKVKEAPKKQVASAILTRSASEGRLASASDWYAVIIQDPKSDDPFQLVPLPNIAQYLRDRIPTVKACDGLRIDRCFYDPQGVFRIEGLADHAGHSKELKPFLDDEKAPFDRKRQLAKGWGEGRQTVIALRPMMVSLRENLPSLPEFDGFTLTRAHHDPKNQLVLTGHAIGDADAKEMAEILKRLLNTHPRWRLRTTFGVVVDITDRKKADRDLAEKLTYKALHLLQVNIAEARIEPLPPSCIGWMSHAWPFDPKLPRVRPTDHDYAMCLEYLDAALLNDSKNVLAWYLRGYVLQTRNRADLTLRDFRRMVELENEDAELRHNRILALELVQGVWRQRAYRIEQDALIDVGDGWTLRSLRESPVAPDTPK